MPQRPALLEAIASLSREGLATRRLRRDILGRLNDAVAGKSSPDDWQRALQRAVWFEKVRIALREALPARLGGAERRRWRRWGG
jgi:hypothetical protein